MRNTSSRGDISEIEIAAALIRSGKRVLRPMWSDARYDLLIDAQDGTFLRVQCKTGILRGGSVIFRVYSVSGHGGRSVPYHGQIDAFGVFSPDTRASYLVPVAAIGNHSAMVSLRIEPARNSQRLHVHLARDFVIG